MLYKLFNDYVSSKARTKSSDIISAIFSLSQPLGHPDVLRGLLPVGTGSWRQYSTDGEILSWGKEEAWLLVPSGRKELKFSEPLPCRSILLSSSPVPTSAR